MVTLGEPVEDEVASDKSQQRKILDSGYHELQSNQEGNAVSMSSEKEMGESQKTRRGTELSASRCNEDGNNLSTISEKALNGVEQIKSSDSASRDQTSQSSQEGPLSVIPVRALPRQSPDTSPSGDQTSVANQDGTSLSQMPDRVADNLPQRHGSGTRDTSQSNQEGNGLPATPEKVRDSLQLSLSSNMESNLLKCDQEGRNSSRTPDKVSQDGYNWRKYGQKLVKGNEFIRSYYRCTHPNCPAKRQVERSQGGHITDTVYLGKHDHPKPQPSPQIAVGLVVPAKKRRDEPSLATGEDKSSNAHDTISHHVEPVETPRLSIVSPDGAVEGAISQSNRTTDAVDHSGIQDSKRQKSDISETPAGERRVVVQTMNAIDIVNDGYRWRKYGQKYVKGNANPRSYYRCSNPGCPAKKHVERAAHDPKMVIATYEGQHSHDMPPARTITVNAAGANSNVTSLNGESRSPPEEKSSVGLEMVVHASAN